MDAMPHGSAPPGSGGACHTGAAGGGAGPSWHDTAASTAHEWAHWNGDYVGDAVTSAAGGNWAAVNARIDALTVPKAGNADAAASFGNTLRFAAGGPVFDLPDGYTIDSPSGGIADNVFVPEPSTLSLTLLGAGILTGLRRARRLPR